VIGLTTGQPIRKSLGEAPLPIVVQARLLDASGNVLARYSNWPEPWKYLSFPDAGLQITAEGDSVTLSCSQPIKGIVLEVEGEDCQWGDQAIDLMPGDDQVISANGLNGRKISAKVSRTYCVTKYSSWAMDLRRVDFLYANVCLAPCDRSGNNPTRQRFYYPGLDLLSDPTPHLSSTCPAMTSIAESNGALDHSQHPARRSQAA